MPISKPRSSAMRAEIGSNTEPGWTQRFPLRISRKRRRRSVQFMTVSPNAVPNLAKASQQCRIAFRRANAGRSAVWDRGVAFALRGEMPVRCIRSPKKAAHGGNAMFDVLDRQTTLTGNQKKILAAAIIGDALEFFDFFLIAFVFAFLIGPWKLTL